MRRGLACAVAAGVASLLAAAPAGGAHHLIKISEVFSGSTAAPGAVFVELQLTAAGENQVTFGMGSRVQLYLDNGTSAASAPFASNPPNGENQRTILAGCPSVEGTFGVTLDLVLTCAFIPARSGGTACFNSTPFGSLDCVRWGVATIAPAGTSPTGTPEPAIPDGMSLTRSIATSCATLHEFSDDTDDSANDFAPTTPSPRPNSVAPTETGCAPPPPDSDGDGVPDSSDVCPNQAASTADGCPPGDGGGGGGGADTDPPDTTITKSPPNRTANNTVTYKFRSNEQGSTFECKIDKKPFKPCTSPKRVKRLDDGRHSFKVRATDAAGNVDATAAGDRFKVVED